MLNLIIMVNGKDKFIVMKCVVLWVLIVKCVLLKLCMIVCVVIVMVCKGFVFRLLRVLFKWLIIGVLVMGVIVVVGVILFVICKEWLLCVK